MLPADAPSESPGEWKARTGSAWATAATAFNVFFSTGVA